MWGFTMSGAFNAVLNPLYSLSDIRHGTVHVRNLFESLNRAFPKRDTAFLIAVISPTWSFQSRLLLVSCCFSFALLDALR